PARQAAAGDPQEARVAREARPGTQARDGPHALARPGRGRPGPSGHGDLPGPSRRGRVTPPRGPVPSFVGWFRRTFETDARVPRDAAAGGRRGARASRELKALMAGHSHAANIAHRKGIVDAKRGKLFSKLCRAIQVAAKNGGGDPDANLRLRYAIDKARSYSVPKENIERSIKKGSGELGAETFEDVIYEG